MHSHNPLVYIAWRFTLKLFFFLYVSDISQNTHSHQTQSYCLLLSVHPNLLSQGRRRKAFMQNRPSALIWQAHSHIQYVQIYTLSTLLLSNRVPDESMPIITAIPRCRQFMQISNLLEINSVPVQKIISFFASPYFLSHTCTRATIRHTRAQQHVVTDKLWEVVAIKNMSKLETTRQCDSCGGTSQHHRTFICK